MIRTVDVNLGGRAHPDVTALELNGTAVPIADDRSWTVTISVGAEQVLALTTYRKGRRSTRLIHVSGLTRSATDPTPVPAGVA